MEDTNTIYTAPDSNLKTEEQEIDDVFPASAGLRLANMFIDYIAYLALMFVFAILAGTLFGAPAVNAIEKVPEFLLGLPIYLLYYLILESTTSRTLGKLITGTKVVNQQGLTPSFVQIVGRTFCRLIPFEIFSFLGDETVGWHDSFSKTRVVKCR
ncbi:RDD family protein [Teredinibacter haidensis]|uniref:RDD family protein n=1 Tax=Teredinibacter haidensis TaxID=2731755 RepID=UPI000948F6A5|nr:RDD family protein [Teredinibacter haidensis]